MLARVKADSRITVVTACGGKTYVRNQWREVPDWAHDEAERNPYLETQGEAVVEESPEPGTTETESVAEPKHVGGGWYELPDGTSVRGREAARKAMQEFVEGGE